MRTVFFSHVLAKVVSFLYQKAIQTIKRAFLNTMQVFMII